MNVWISTEAQMPPNETPVLAFFAGECRILERRNYTPYEGDPLAAHGYWDDPTDDGQDINNSEVTYWMTLPEPPMPAETSIMTSQHRKVGTPAQPL